jgi:hypothetical protein
VPQPESGQNYSSAAPGLAADDTVWRTLLADWNRLPHEVPLSPSVEARILLSVGHAFLALQNNTFSDP